MLDPQTNKRPVPQQVNGKTVAHVKEKEKKSSKKYVDKNYTNWDCIDLTVDSMPKNCQNSSRNNLTEYCQKDCFSNNGNEIDSRSASSVASWTSSSNEILCSKTLWVTNTLTN